jgi:plasmid maintenance system antidote protein VapI
MLSVALRLARYFGTTPEFWIGIQSTYDLETTRDAHGDRIARDVSPRAAWASPCWAST